MPHRLSKAISFAVILWAIGFVWGSIVFMAPSLKASTPIPCVSSNPWISFPILLAWLPGSYFLARSYLRPVHNPVMEGRKLGLVFSLTNFVLDLLVLVVLLQAGIQYFASLTVWFGYALLLLVPWAVGRSPKRAEHQ